MKTDNALMTMIWTNPEAYEESKRLIEERQINCRVLYTELQDAVELARSEVKRGTKLLIARGGVWTKIQENVAIPMVAIRFTFSDYASAIEKASKYGNKIAVIVFSPEMHEAVKKENYYWAADTMFVQVSDNEAARREIAKLAAQGVKAFVGGITIKRLAEEQGLPCFVYGYNRDAILEAIRDAERLLELFLALETRYKTISMLLDNSSQGMMTLDMDARITNINEVALRMIGRTYEKKSVLGNSCMDFFPIGKVVEGALDGKYYYDYLVKFQNRYLAVSAKPIIEGTKSDVVIIGIHDSDEIQTVETKIRRRYAAHEYVAKYTFSNIIGESQAVSLAKQHAMMYAGVDSTVMITGESGTGKEMFAQSIHNASARRNNPFVAVNCAAFPESLLESVLFGYEKGAFTGANPGGRAGIFEVAHKGTIFLDEIGEMPVNLQSRLLRVLQEREVTRVGGTAVIPVDVRVITATNRNIFDEMEKGNFRSDLYYRLSVLILTLPPLRERPQDIALLVRYFIEMFSNKYKRNVKGISAEAEALLEAQSFPGNIRELSNIIERAVIFTNSSQIEKETIEMSLEAYPGKRQAEREKPEKSGRKAAPSIPGKEKIEQALHTAGGNHQQAASILGVSRTTFWRWMKKYGIEE